ncbi:MAG TPA: hypothetical protein VKB51_17535 [bacterium]|nr:hypothetical protein [bacterium]
MTIIATPERSIIAIAAWRPRTKLAVFAIAYAAYWLLGVFLGVEGIIAWRLFGFFVPIYAALVWGGAIGMGVFLVTATGIHALLASRGIPLVGSAAGPLMGVAAMIVIGMLRYYIMQLHAAHTRIAMLEGVIPICASCKKIRDDAGQWHPVEAYVATGAGAQFSHGLCPDCVQEALRPLDHP